MEEKVVSFEERLAAIVDGNRPRPFYCVNENGTVTSSHGQWLDAQTAKDPHDK